MKKLIYQIFMVLILTLAFASLNGQQDQNIPWDIWRNPTTLNFNEIQAEAENYFANRDRGRGSGYKQWKRWEAHNQTRLDVNGNIVNYAPIYNREYQKEMKKIRSSSDQRNLAGDWDTWSATNYQNSGSWSPGIGRVNVIAYHPTDPNTLYVGTPAGGLFRTTNNGGTWQALTNDLASIGVSGIAIQPDNPNIIYILTGDGDGGDTRSIGVYKSTNGGATWNPTGLVWSTDIGVSGYKLVMEPGDPTYLIAVTNIGIWRTTNSGTDWTLVLPGSYTDVEYKPGTPSNVYASSAGVLWKSTNWGGTWLPVYFVPGGASRTQIAVTPDEPNVVYLMNGPDILVNNQPGFRGVFRSTDSGATFNLQDNTPNALGGSLTGGGTGDQSTYDLAIACSPVNDSIILTGGVNIYRSSTAGTNLSLEAHWDITDVNNNPQLTLAYVHADIHHLSYNPLNNRLYAGADGGIFFSDDNGENWTDITSGLGISQIYHFDGRDADPSYMLAGMQDNGTSIMRKDTMFPVLGADGGDCLLHPTNANIMYAMWQNGTVRKATNGGIPGGQANWPTISPTGSLNGPFITRWDMDKNNPDTIYVGWSNDVIYRTYNGGSTWTTLNLPNGFGEDVRKVVVADNGSTIYAATCTRAWRSFDRGATWGTIYTSTTFCITSLAKVGSFPEFAIITLGGFAGGATRVFLWNDSDDSISPIQDPTPNSADTLPPVPVNCAATSAFNGLANIYVGTDIGTYFYSFLNPTAGWQYFGIGLPNVPVRDIYIYDDIGRMRVATFGRGIWESDVYDNCFYNLYLTQANDPTFGLPGTVTEKAADQIFSSRLIAGITTNNVTYQAGDLILLQDGFLAQENATFIAGNSPCAIPLDSFNDTGPTDQTSLKAQREEEMAERLEKEAEAKEKEGN